MTTGIDEAGRGCLCGSLFVAGVACDQSTADYLLTHGVKDSKTTSKSKRKQLFHLITTTPNLFYHIVEKNPHQIDTKGLSLCLKESIQEIMDFLKCHSHNFLFDGNTTFHIKPAQNINLTSIIKGDSKIPQIAAASILAKYSKDKEMEELHTKYPNYDFISHSGYGTKKHLEKIELLGYTPYHRRSFIIKKSSLF